MEARRAGIRRRRGAVHDSCSRRGEPVAAFLIEDAQAMSQLPAHPRIAHLLIRGHELGLSEQACDLAALLGERDIRRGGGADVHSRLAMLSGQRVHRDAQRAKQLARQYRSFLQGASALIRYRSRPYPVDWMPARACVPRSYRSTTASGRGPIPSEQWTGSNVR